MEAHMVERRQAQRTRVLKGAKIILNSHASVIDCTVRNLTNLGACVQASVATLRAEYRNVCRHRLMKKLGEHELHSAASLICETL